MRLTTYSDYALRCLIFLAIQEDQEKLLNIKNIADEFEISQNHLTKIIHQLATIGYIESVRGRNGGIRLAKSPASINLAEVIKQTEADFNLVECFASNATCRIQGACCLNSILDQAVKALFLVLDRYTLADLLVNPQGLIPVRAVSAESR